MRQDYNLKNCFNTTQIFVTTYKLTKALNMTLKEYTKRQIAKTYKKDYENYVVTRFIHLINDSTIKFVTQQLVINEEGKRFLADLYFPQIGTFIEIDEAHHLSNTESDRMRDFDFEKISGNQTIRINVSKNSKTKKEYSISDINLQIENAIKTINERIYRLKVSNKFTPWDIENEYNPEIWIKKGVINTKDNVEFKSIVDACKCFGLNYKRYYKAGAKHPYKKNTLIWFPKLYHTSNWRNSLNELEDKIITISLNDRVNHINDCLNSSFKRRVVFAHIKDNLGDIKYRFRGVFELSISDTNYNTGVVWNRISETTNTYNYIKK